MRPTLFSTTAVALVAAISACTVTAAEPGAVPPPPPPGPVAEAPAPPPPVVDDEDVVYDNVAPPVANIEEYPAVAYGGGTVYYVGGIWYRRGPNGWGRYRAEPPALMRVRVTHAREARWAREGAPRPAPPGAAQMQRRPLPPAPPPPAREVR